ncbi:TBC1 domain containing protein 3, partial [Sarcoptes scabiei]
FLYYFDHLGSKFFRIDNDQDLKQASCWSVADHSNLHLIVDLLDYTGSILKMNCEQNPSRNIHEDNSDSTNQSINPRMLADWDIVTSSEIILAQAFNKTNKFIANQIERLKSKTFNIDFSPKTSVLTSSSWLFAEAIYQYIVNDEAQAYITFCALMKRLHKNFSPTGTAMNRKFRNLKRLLSYYDPEFYRYLINEKAEEMLFSYRWILLDLKREFPLDNVPDMLEVLWASIPPKSNVSNSDDMLFDTEHLYVPNTQSDCEKVNNYQSTAEIFNKTNDAKVFTPNTKERISKSKSSIVRNSNFFNYDEDSISEFNSSSSYDGDGEYDEPIKKRSKNYKRSSLERSQIKHKEENFSTEEEDDLFLEGRRQVDILSNHSMDHGYSTDQKSLSSLVHHPSRIRSYSLSSRPNKDRNRSEMNLMSKSKSPTSKSVNSMNYLKNSKLFSAIEDIEESCNVDDINEQFNILSARSVSEQILNSTIKKMETLSIDEKNSSSIELISVPNDFEKLEEEFTLISPEQLGSSDAFMLFLCLTLLLQNRDHIMEKKMDRNEIQMYFDSMIRKHNVHDVLQDARYLFHSYLAEWHQNQSKKLNLM